jgi:hypothetical protein
MHLRESAAGMPIHAGDSTLEQEFAGRACERLRAVAETVTGGFTGLRQ